jgi:hypothetical protein
MSWMFIENKLQWEWEKINACISMQVVHLKQKRLLQSNKSWFTVLTSLYSVYYDSMEHFLMWNAKHSWPPCLKTF